MCVATYAAPPASTVAPVSSIIRPEEPVGGSRLPWKSLRASSRTGTVFGALLATAGAVAAANPPAATAPASTSRRRERDVMAQDATATGYAADVAKVTIHPSVTWRYLPVVRLEFVL